MKKLLALVLALVMTLSLCVTSNAAYTDAADIDYTEAVDVMSAVGVFQGSDGKFDPKANLTREQAAKLIAYLDLGETVAEALPAVKVFNDVEANRWSAKYIAYCADAGYIAGVGDGNFDPAGKLTGYAFGKMLLCALGYDAAIEGMTGSSWSIKVAKLMESNKIAKNVTGAISATLTREQAAQYCLNTLKATCVNYGENQSTITIGDVVIKQTNVASPTGETGYFSGGLGANLQLAEKLFNGSKAKFQLLDAPKDAANADPTSRNVKYWAYDGKDICSTSVEADHTFVVTSISGVKVALANWLTEINSSYTTVSNVPKSMANLGDADGATPGNACIVYMNGDQQKNGSNTPYAPVVGDIVDVYESTSETNLIDRIVVTHYQLAKITKVDTAVNENDKKDGVSAYVTLKYTHGGSTKTLNDTAIVGFDAATYVKDAFVAVAFNSDKNSVVASNVATSVEGVVTAYKGDTTAITLDGTKYDYAATAYNEYTDDDFEGTYAVWTDVNGLAIGVTEVKAGQVATDAVYANDIWVKTGSNDYAKTTATYYAQMVDTEGVSKNEVIGFTTSTGKIVGNALVGTSGSAYTFTLDETKDTVGELSTSLYYVVASTGLVKQASKGGSSWADTDVADAIGYDGDAGTADAKVAGIKFYTISDDASGEKDKLYTLTEKDDGYKALTAFEDKGSTYVGTVADFDGKTSTDAKFFDVSVNSTTKTVYTTADTKYIIVNGDQADIKTYTKSGANVAITVTDASIEMITKKTGNSYEATYVFIDSSNYAGGSGSLTDLLYVYSNSATNVKNGDQITVYKMDGTTETITVADASGLTADRFYTYTVNTKGVYTLTETSTGNSNLIKIDSANETWSKDTDDHTGSVANATFVSNYNNYIAFTSTNTLHDVTVNANVVVVDKHEKDQDEYAVDLSFKNNDYTYAGTVASVADMDAATDSGYTVYFSAYVDENGVEFISVNEVSK